MTVQNDSIYGYTPSKSIAVVFVALFSVSGTIHIVQAVYFRLWWVFPTIVLACLGEVLGWTARLWSSSDPALLDPYLMQISTTIIAPTPLVAANFVILGVLIRKLGLQYSRIGPGLYTTIFCAADVVALIVQAIGGASASTAVGTGRNPAKGGRIMLGGIAFQMVAITIYVALATEFLYRYCSKKPVRWSGNSVTDVSKEDVKRGTDRRTQLMIFGLGLSTLCIFIRAVYRTIELSDGWTGRIINTQVYFNVLDGAMILIAAFTLNILHPGLLLIPYERLKDARSALIPGKSESSTFA